MILTVMFSVAVWKAENCSTELKNVAIKHSLSEVSECIDNLYSPLTGTSTPKPWLRVSDGWLTILMAG